MDALIRWERLLEEIRPYYPSFTGISLSKAPDETTILNFRHLLERHGLPQVLFESIKDQKNENRLALLLVHGIAGMPIRANPGFMLHRGPGAGPRLGRRGG